MRKKRKKLNKKYGTGRAQNKQSKSRRRSNETGTLLSLTEVGVFQSWCDTGTQIKTPSASGKVTCLGHWPSRVVVIRLAPKSLLFYSSGTLWRWNMKQLLCTWQPERSVTLNNMQFRQKWLPTKGDDTFREKRLSNKKSSVLGILDYVCE